MSGARLDLGQPEAALAELEIPQLDPDRAFSYSADLFHAYAEVLEELGREAQARQWRERAERAEAALDVAHALDEHETVDIIEEDIVIDSSDEAPEPATGEGTDDGKDEPNDGPVSTEQ
ncbi:hypothetical protein ACRAWC_24660 [Leifsonia sp. L25]